MDYLIEGISSVKAHVTDIPDVEIHVIVVTQARVHCLICMHDARGCAMPKGECGHIRQCTSACVATNMLHFRYSKKLLFFALPIYITRDSNFDYGIFSLTFL